jgi:hypothetical protein
MISPITKHFLFKGLIFIFIFVLLSIGFFGLLNFYKNKILKEIEAINKLKEQIAISQGQADKATRLQKLDSLIYQKTGKNLKEIISEVQRKLNRDFQTTRALIFDKLTKENWEIKRTNFQENDKIIEVTFQILQPDYDKFFAFLEEEGILWQIRELRIDKTENAFVINLKLQTK